jgi:thiosulfate/3-mercaptopyruvate sulfurtransferase
MTRSAAIRPRRKENRAARPVPWGVALVLACLAAPIPAQWPPWLAKKETKPPVYPEIVVDAAWLREHRAELLVLDARPAEAFRSGHVPGAFSLPDAGVGPKVGAAIEESRRSGREILVCGEGGAAESGALLFWNLELAGATNARFLSGGFEAWAAAGEAVEKGSRDLSGAGGPVPPDPARIATVAYVADHYGGDGFEVIDLRDSASWEGRPGSSRGGERRGHIPHALPFDPRAVLVSDGAILTGPEIRAVFSELGPRRQTRIDIRAEMLLYDDGVSGRGALAYLLLRMAGIEKVRYFPGGWVEWSSDPALPVVRVVSAEELRRLQRPKGRRDESLAPVPLVIDVRDRRDHGLGRVPGSICIPSFVFRDSLDAILDAERPGLDRSTDCYGTDCIRSRQCATWAARAGFPDLLWFRGGIVEWKEEGLEIDRDAP